MIEFVVPGPPRGKGAPKARVTGRFAHIYADPKTRSYEACIKFAAAEAMKGKRLITGAVYLGIHAQIPIPASWSAKKRLAAIEGRIKPTVKPDWDNVGKTADALKGIVWEDDKQVVLGVVTKAYSMSPMTIFQIEEADV